LRRVPKLKQVTQELAGAFGNDDAVRLCKALQACGEVRRLPNNAALLRFSSADQIADYDQSSSNFVASFRSTASKPRTKLTSTELPQTPRRCHKDGSGGEWLDLHSVAKVGQPFD
jgi:hypothetical protein